MYNRKLNWEWDLFELTKSKYVLQTIVDGDRNTLVFEELDPDTPYDVSITAVYPDESESEDLMGNERTSKNSFLNSFIIL